MMRGEERVQLRQVLLLLLIALSPLIATDFLLRRNGGGGGGGGGCSKAVAIAGGGPHTFIAEAATPAAAESLLRLAMVRNRTTVLRLRSDVHLTADLPEMTCPDLTVISKCRARGGRPKRCKINGRKTFSGFLMVRDHLNLTLIDFEITGFVSRSGKQTEFLRAVGGLIKIRGCLFLNNGSPLISQTTGTGVKVEGSKFVANRGDLIQVSYSSVDAKDVIFRANANGTPIDLVRSDLTCRGCVFENNTALTGAAVVSAVSGAFCTFFNSRLVGNALTEVGARGGAVSLRMAGSRFCNCTFERNTVNAPRGRTILEHVYAEEAQLFFCKQRPPAGVNVVSSTVNDSCTDCPLID